MLQETLLGKKQKQKKTKQKHYEIVLFFGRVGRKGKELHVCQGCKRKENFMECEKKDL